MAYFGSLILAAIVGFVLGILLMIFLTAGREEEKLLERIERVEALRRDPQVPQGGTDVAASKSGGGDTEGRSHPARQV